MSETEPILEPEWYIKIKKVLPLQKLAADSAPLDLARDLAARSAVLALYTLADLMLNDPNGPERGAVADETRRKSAEDTLKFATGELLGATAPSQESSHISEQWIAFARANGGPTE